MIFIWLYFVIYLYIFYFDIVPIIKKNHNKLAAINIFFTLLSFTIVVLVALNIKVPSPNDFIERIVRVFIG